MIGAPGESSNASGINGDETDNSKLESGAVYIYQNVWRERDIIQMVSFTQSYFSLTLNDNTLVIGASGNSSTTATDESDPSIYRSGAVYVYQINSVGVEQKAFIKAPDPQIKAFFGTSVALSGNMLVIGEPYRSVDVENLFHPGAAYVFKNESGDCRWLCWVWSCAYF